MEMFSRQLMFVDLGQKDPEYRDGFGGQEVNCKLVLKARKLSETIKVRIECK